MQGIENSLTRILPWGLFIKGCMFNSWDILQNRLVPCEMCLDMVVHVSVLNTPFIVTFVTILLCLQIINEISANWINYFAAYYTYIHSECKGVVSSRRPLPQGLAQALLLDQISSCTNLRWLPRQAQNLRRSSDSVWQLSHPWRLSCTGKYRDFSDVRGIFNLCTLVFQCDLRKELCSI